MTGTPIIKQINDDKIMKIVDELEQSARMQLMLDSPRFKPSKSAYANLYNKYEKLRSELTVAMNKP